MKDTNHTGRTSNIELLRIVAMLMIIGHHYVYYGVWQNYAPEIANVLYHSGSTVNKLWANLLLPGGVVGVAIFFLLAGYFGIRQDQVSVSKIVQPVVFYGVCGLAVSLIYSLASGEPIAIVPVIRSVFPLGGSLYWFATVYVMLMAAKPYINSLINRLSGKGLLLAILFMGVEYGAVRYINGGHLGIVQGLFYYTVGAYIRRNAERLCQVNSYFCLFFAFVFWLMYGIVNRISSAAGYLTATVVLGTLISVLLVLAFLSGKQFVSEWINWIGRHTFGAYLFHEHILLRKLLWSGMLKVDSQWGSRYFIGLSVLTIFGVFFLGVCFDAFKQKYVDIWTERTQSLVSRGLLHEKI